MTLRSNSVKRSSRRRARRVSAGMNEDVLATDSGVFEAWSRRLEWHFNTHTHTQNTKKLKMHIKEYLPSITFVTLQSSMMRGFEEHEAQAKRCSPVMLCFQTQNLGHYWPYLLIILRLIPDLQHSNDLLPKYSLICTFIICLITQNVAYCIMNSPYNGFL